MTPVKRKENVRFENIDSMFLIASIFGLFGLFVLLAAYLIERFDLLLDSSVNIYIYSVIPFGIAGLLALLSFILWLLNKQSLPEDKETPSNLE